MSEIDPNLNLVAQLYDNFHKSKGGFMDQMVFQQFVRSLTISICDDESNELFGMIDKDDSGYITLTHIQE